MKTRPGRFPVLSILAVLAGAVFLTGGCTTKTGRLTRPPPPAYGMDDIHRHQQVAARTSELIKSGKYKSLDAARAAAESEYPAATDPSAATWSSEYAQYEKQKADEEKFQADFAKSIRHP